MGTIRLQLMAVMFSCSLLGQSPNEKTVSERESASAILSRFLGRPPEIERATRFAITLRFVPDLEPESQVSVVCMTGKKCQLTQRELSRALGTTIQEIIQKSGKQPDLARLKDLVKVRSASTVIDERQGIAWLQGLSQAISETSSRIWRKASELEGSEMVDVFLDAAAYEVYYWDAGKHFEISVPGPDPNQVEDLTAVEPLVRWMITVQRQVRILDGLGKP